MSGKLIKIVCNICYTIAGAAAAQAIYCKGAHDGIKTCREILQEDNDTIATED